MAKVSKKDMPIRASQIQNELYARLRSSSKLIMPNFTPNGWWESDAYVVSLSGLATEYEIKITRADYERDKLKHTLRDDGFQTVSDGMGGTKRTRVFTPVYKHDRMRDADPYGPSRFYFIVPEGLVTAEEVPEWAGLKTVKRGNGSGRIMITKVKNAPLRHSIRVPQRIFAQAESVMPHRLWRLRQMVSDEVLRLAEGETSILAMIEQKEAEAARKMLSTLAIDADTDEYICPVCSAVIDHCSNLVSERANGLRAYYCYQCDSVSTVGDLPVCEETDSDDEGSNGDDC